MQSVRCPFPKRAIKTIFVFDTFEMAPNATILYFNSYVFRVLQIGSWSVLPSLEVTLLILFKRTKLNRFSVIKRSTSLSSDSLTL